MSHVCMLIPFRPDEPHEHIENERVVMRQRREKIIAETIFENPDSISGECEPKRMIWAAILITKICQFGSWQKCGIVERICYVFIFHSYVVSCALIYRWFAPVAAHQRHVACYRAAPNMNVKREKCHDFDEEKPSRVWNDLGDLNRKKM